MQDIRLGNFTRADICRATDIKPQTLKTWVARGYLNPLHPRPGTGHSRVYTFFEVIRVAIMVDLVIDLMIPIAQAYELAKQVEQDLYADPNFDPASDPAFFVIEGHISRVEITDSVTVAADSNNHQILPLRPIISRTIDRLTQKGVDHG